MDRTITSNFNLRYNNQPAFGKKVQTAPVLEEIEAAPAFDETEDFPVLEEMEADTYVREPKKKNKLARAVLFAAAVTTAVAYVRGRRMNLTMGNESKFLSNLKEGFETFYGKGKEAYNIIVNKNGTNVPRKPVHTDPISGAAGTEKLKPAVINPDEAEVLTGEAQRLQAPPAASKPPVVTAPPAEKIEPPVEKIEPPVEKLEPSAAQSSVPQGLEPRAEKIEPPVEPPVENVESPVEKLDPPTEKLEPSATQPSVPEKLDPPAAQSTAPEKLDPPAAQSTAPEKLDPPAAQAQPSGPKYVLHQEEEIELPISGASDADVHKLEPAPSMPAEPQVNSGEQAPKVKEAPVETAELTAERLKNIELDVLSRANDEFLTLEFGWHGDAIDATKAFQKAGREGFMSLAQDEAIITSGANGETVLTQMNGDKIWSFVSDIEGKTLSYIEVFDGDNKVAEILPSRFSPEADKAVEIFTIDSTLAFDKLGRLNSYTTDGAFILSGGAPEGTITKMSRYASDKIVVDYSVGKNLPNQSTDVTLCM